MIATFTDFGTNGPYLGQLRAALWAGAPHETVVDVFNDLPIFNIKSSAYLIPAYCRQLPDSCVCLCVVDPGVGSDRQPLALEVDGRWFVGPDNGLFSVLLRRARRKRFFRITWRPEVLSDSFHGRDLFAPIAARLASSSIGSADLEEIGSVLIPDWQEELEEILYIDRYGNAISGIRAASLSPRCDLRVGGLVFHHARTFSDVPIGQRFWYENANGLVELAVSQGCAADSVGLGMTITIVAEPGQ